jgi:protein AFG1
LKKDQYREIAKMKSVYLWGHPGCGKTFLMDLFFESLGPHVGKRKLHYNEFMLEIHKEEHALNQKLKNQNKDTIA